MEPGHLTAQTEDLLHSKYKKVIIVGGTVAVSDDVKLAVEGKTSQQAHLGQKLYADGG